MTSLNQPKPWTISGLSEVRVWWGSLHDISKCSFFSSFSSQIDLQGVGWSKVYVWRTEDIWEREAHQFDSHYDRLYALSVPDGAHYDREHFLLIEIQLSISSVNSNRLQVLRVVWRRQRLTAVSCMNKVVLPCIWRTDWRGFRNQKVWPTLG